MKAFPELTVALGEMLDRMDGALRALATDAMAGFVGDKRPLLLSLDLVARELGAKG